MDHVLAVHGRLDILGRGNPSGSIDRPEDIADIDEAKLSAARAAGAADVLNSAAAIDFVASARPSGSVAGLRAGRVTGRVVLKP